MTVATQKSSEDEFSDLRRQAEEIVRRQSDGEMQDWSPEKMRYLLHELRVHQVELEMQNIELRRVQLGLEAACDRYIDLYDFAPIGYLTLSVNEVILEANLTAAKLLGVEEGRLIGQPLARFIAMEDRDTYYIQRRQQLESQTPQVFEVSLLKQGGLPFHGRIEAIVVQGVDGVPIRRVVLSDITERKQLEEALRQTQKIESLGVLAGGIAHDFNNLLVAMLGQTSLALEKLPLDNAAYMHIAKAVDAAERASELARQMLLYSGRGHFEIQPLHLKTLIEEKLSLYEAGVPKSVSLTWELDESLPLIEADAGQIQQALMNLILNAVEAIGERQGTVTISSAARQMTPEDSALWKHTGTALSAGRYVALEVRDDGDGISADNLPKVFDPFFSTRFAGRGLGLAVVLGIVRGHKGGVMVESELGQGAIFRLVFPALEVESSASVPASRKRPAQIAGRQAAAQILAIDDEVDVREAVSDILEFGGLRVLTAASGVDGLRHYHERHAEIDLVLLDLSMPGMSGEETMRELRRINPQARIVLSSGYNQVKALQHFRGLGLTGFIQKPYSAKTLLQEIKRYLGS